MSVIPWLHMMTLCILGALAWCDRYADEFVAKICIEKPDLDPVQAMELTWKAALGAVIVVS